MPLVVSILCCLQIIGGLSLIIVAAYSHKTLQFSVEKINIIAQKLSKKMNEKYDKKKVVADKDVLSKEEIDKINNYLEYLGDNVKLQITMSFLSLYFIGSKITSRPIIPLFPTFVFAMVNVHGGFSLLFGGKEGWYFGICACIYALLRNVHALVLLPKLAKTLSQTVFKVNQFYIKYTIRSCVLILLIYYFFSPEVMDYFSVEQATVDILIIIEIAAVSFVLLDFVCYKIQEWTTSNNES
ncbi:hypothetical protein [Candidatus Uabimicrobium sp. HlEnr_7]|uniref:hypothetical protein n=1 Tax=Candidatus Uabimicrobium helgolandensis TaxID=3095367 RepID=UPI003555E104